MQADEERNQPENRGGHPHENGRRSRFPAGGELFSVFQ
jgi:hypothetical protein